MNYKALIIGILIGGMVIVGASIYVGIAVRDVEVEDNAYEAGLKYDEVNKREAELGWQVNVPRNVKTGAVVIPIDVHDRGGAAVRDVTVEVELSRMGGHQAQTYRCTNSGDGRYLAEVKLNATGYWDAWVRVHRRNDSIRFNDTIYVQ